MTAPDRLSLIESRWREAGSGDGDMAWLLAEVKRLRAAIRKHFEPHPEVNGMSWACGDPELMATVKEE
jgi:hypothetical protein